MQHTAFIWHAELPFWVLTNPTGAVQIQLSIAPIDAVYSQFALLRMVAVLNAGWPPPTLDPVVVRTSVMLSEIVRERLVGPRRPHQVQRHQQSQLQVQVRASPTRSQRHIILCKISIRFHVDPMGQQKAL